MNIRLNKEKSIGKVLYIVEGGKTEPYRIPLTGDKQIHEEHRKRQFRKK